MACTISPPPTTELQEKLSESQDKQYQLFKVLRTHILPLTNAAINKPGSR